MNHLKLLFLVSLALLILLPFAINAGQNVIDTNDGVVDANWVPDPFLSDPVGDSSVEERDIVSVWMLSDAPFPSEYFFRLRRLSGANDGLSRFYAELDCDGNGRFTDSIDRQIIYVVSEDVVLVYTGHDPDFFITPTPIATSAAAGEVTARGDIEWRSGMAVLGNDCQGGSVLVRFRALGTAVDDETDVRRYTLTTSTPGPTPTVTNTPTSTPYLSPTPTPVETATPTLTPTQTAVPTRTPSPTATATILTVSTEEHKIFLPLIKRQEAS